MILRSLLVVATPYTWVMSHAIWYRWLCVLTYVWCMILLIDMSFMCDMCIRVLYAIRVRRRRRSVSASIVRCAACDPFYWSVVCTTLFTAPEASWRRGFDPCTPLLFDLYHYLEQNGYFWLVPEHALVPSSQVLPGCRVRHPYYFKKLFVRYMLALLIAKHGFGQL